MITVGYEYCYLDCKTLTDFTINLFNGLLGLLITAFVVRNFVVARRTRDYQKVRPLYFLMMLWGFSTYFFY